MSSMGGSRQAASAGVEINSDCHSLFLAEELHDAAPGDAANGRHATRCRRKSLAASPAIFLLIDACAHGRLCCSPKEDAMIITAMRCRSHDVHRHACQVSASRAFGHSSLAVIGSKRLFLYFADGAMTGWRQRFSICRHSHVYRPAR